MLALTIDQNLLHCIADPEVKIPLSNVNQFPAPSHESLKNDLDMANFQTIGETTSKTSPDIAYDESMAEKLGRFLQQSYF